MQPKCNFSSKLKLIPFGLSIYRMIGASCSVVVPAITEAIQTWQEVNSCGTSPRGETCTTVSSDHAQQYSLRGVEITFDGGFVSSFLFRMISHDNSCTVRAHGFTTKEEVTDPDFNYCTLQYIMNTSTMTALYGYSQLTDPGMCNELLDVYCEDNLVGIERMEPSMQDYKSQVPHDR